MAIVDELKEIGAMLGIAPVGNNILEVVKSMKQQVAEMKEKSVAAEKAEPVIITEPVIYEEKPVVETKKARKKAEKKSFTDDGTIKFTKD